MVRTCQFTCFSYRTTDKALYRRDQRKQRPMLEFYPHESSQRRASELLGLAGFQRRLQGRARTGCDAADDEVDGGSRGAQRLWPDHGRDLEPCGRKSVVQGPRIEEYLEVTHGGRWTSAGEDEDGVNTVILRSV